MSEHSKAHLFLFSSKAFQKPFQFSVGMVFTGLFNWPVFLRARTVLRSPEQYSEYHPRLSLPMMSAVFKPFILPVKTKNSLIPTSLQKQCIWEYLTCLVSVTVWPVASVEWCTIFYPWAGVYCGLILPLWPGKSAPVLSSEKLSVLDKHGDNLRTSTQVVLTLRCCFVY